MNSTNLETTRVEGLFRLSSYSTLLLACATLVFAQYDIAPSTWITAIIAIPLIIAAFFARDRWTMPNWIANVLALAIGSLVVCWFISESSAPADEGPNKRITLPWPTNLVPLLGPVLMVLLPIKLFRPKTIGDHWGLQIIGLACVGLGCATVSTNDDGTFAVLLLAYLLSLLWCLALFFLYRERLVRPAAERPRTPRLRQVLSWAVPIFALGIIGFVFLPRSTAVWQVPRPEQKAETGQTDDTGLDLTRTGALLLDPEIAFEVQASYDETGISPKKDLSQDTRWRGPVFRYYFNGSWRRNPLGRFAESSGDPGAGSSINVSLPEYQIEGRYYLTYTVKTRIGTTPFVADPVYQPNPRRVPVVLFNKNNNMQSNWIVDRSGTLIPAISNIKDKDWINRRYRQITIPAPEPFLSHEVPAVTEDLTSVLRQRSPETEKLKDWSETRLAGMVKTGMLPAEAAEPGFHSRIDPKHYEKVAQAFELYLSLSGDYKYSLNLARYDPTLDPTLDFLFNTRSGHCNRFASALALILRSLGIPCQVVTGYRGCESRGDGMYDVRQSFSHTWVEALVVRRQQEPGDRTSDHWHWLTLDPTPQDAAVEAASVGTRWFGMDVNMHRFYHDLIINFTADNRDDFFRNVGLALKTAGLAFARTITAHSQEGMRLRGATVLFAAVVTLASILAVRWLRRRLPRWGLWRPAPYPGTSFYQRLLAVLARRGIRPAAAQTPREFAEAVALSLTGLAEGAALGDIARRAADLFYRVRFGGRPLSPGELGEINSQVDRLATALASAQ